MIVDDHEPVAFIAVESGDDLVLSFYVVRSDDPSDGRSLILMRSPKWEILLPESDRGVKVSDEALSDEGEKEGNFLERIRLDTSTADISSTYYHRKLDVSRVEKSELRAAKRLLKKMNFDKRFKLEVT